MIPPNVLSTCNLSLKQLTLEDFNDDGIAAMSSCFSGFTDPDLDDEYAQQGQQLAQKRFSNEHGIPTDVDLTAARRFAGDRSLSRGRYFTICKDREGNDEGTLVRELLAYHNPEKSGILTIVDPTVPEHQGKVPLYLRGQPLRSLLLLFPPIGGRPHPFATRFTTEAKPMYLDLPLRLSNILVERVIDLRRPETASWFASALSRLDWFELIGDELKALQNPEALRKWIQLSGYRSYPDDYDFDNIPRSTSFNAFPFKRPLETFAEILPALLCQSIGGGRGAAQIAGLWLRKLGVNGLIFPSARCDSRVMIRNGEVIDWSGFNYVDYRETAPTEYLAAIDLSVEWPEKIQTWPDDLTEDPEIIVYDTVAISYEGEGENKGSWAVDGIQRRREAPYCFVELVWLLDQLFGSDDIDAKNVKGVAYDYLQKTWLPNLSHDFVNAFMGVHAARENIQRFAAQPFLNEYEEIRKSIYALLEKTANVALR